MSIFFFACLILTFLSFLANCLFVSVFVCGSVCSGLKAYVSWCYGMDISGNRIQRTARPPRGRSWRVCFPRQLHARFSLRVGFPFSSFSEGPFAFPYLFILPGFGLPCHLVQPYLNMTFQFRYPSSSQCHECLCHRVLGVRSQLAQFHQVVTPGPVSRGTWGLFCSGAVGEAASLGRTQWLESSVQCFLPIFDLVCSFFSQGYTEVLHI